MSVEKVGGERVEIVALFMQTYIIPKMTTGTRYMLKFKSALIPKIQTNDEINIKMISQSGKEKSHT